MINSDENLAFQWQIQCFLEDCISFTEHNGVYRLQMGFSRLFLSTLGETGLQVYLMLNIYGLDGSSSRVCECSANTTPRQGCRMFFARAHMDQTAASLVTHISHRDVKTELFKSFPVSLGIGTQRFGREHWRTTLMHIHWAGTDPWWFVWHNRHGRGFVWHSWVIRNIWM